MLNFFRKLLGKNNSNVEQYDDEINCRIITAIKNRDNEALFSVYRKYPMWVGRGIMIAEMVNNGKMNVPNFKNISQSDYSAEVNGKEAELTRVLIKLEGLSDVRKYHLKSLQKLSKTADFDREFHQCSIYNLNEQIRKIIA